MNKKKSYSLLFASILSFFFFSVSVIMMAFSGNEKKQYISLDIICGIAFWTFLVLGVIFQVILTRYIRVWESKTYPPKRILRISPKIGITSFFKNPPGVVSDVSFVVALLSFVISCWITGGKGIVCYISLSLLIFSFCSHCIFNGKNYYYIVNHKLIEKSYRKKVEESK